MLNKLLLRIAAFSGALSVALGAFAAHGLKKLVTPEMVTTFETGVRYQFYHTFALLILVLLSDKLPSRKLKWSAGCFIAGIILFSGSLYALTALHATDTVGLTGIGVLTPIGGLFFIVGWLMLLV